MKPVYTKELAEFLGILYGDGYINSYPSGHHRIEIAGHAIKDKRYHLEHVQILFQNLFGKNLHTQFRKGQQTIVSRISSKEIVKTLTEAGMVKGRKTDLIIPSWIKDDQTRSRRFLRGLFDTDGSIIIRKRGQHSISLGLKDCTLIHEVKGILEKAGYFVAIHTCTTEDPRGFTSTIHYLRINRKSLIIRFNEEIGSANPEKLKRLKKVAERGNAGI